MPDRAPPLASLQLIWVVHRPFQIERPLVDRLIPANTRLLLMRTLSWLRSDRLHPLAVHMRTTGSIVGLHGTLVEVGSLCGIHIMVMRDSHAGFPGSDLMTARPLLSRACSSSRLFTSPSNKSIADGGRGYGSDLNVRFRQNVRCERIGPGDGSPRTFAELGLISPRSGLCTKGVQHCSGLPEVLVVHRTFQPIHFSRLHTHGEL